MNPSAPPPRVADRRATLLGDLRALAFDLDGTIYLGSQILPGSLELLAALRAASVPVVFATNNSSKTPDQYLSHLTGFGLDVRREEILTSNHVAIDELRAAGVKRPFVVATEPVRAYYRSEGFDLEADDADAVLLTFDTTLDYAKLKRADELIRRGLRYFATHPDLTCPTAEGPIPDCGAFAALLAASTGVWPKVLGKPEAAMARSIVNRLGVAPEGVAFVGDRLYTDVRMAQEQGLVGVLTLTGEAVLDDLEGSEYQPHLTVRDMAELLELLRRAGVVA